MIWCILVILVLFMLYNAIMACVFYVHINDHTLIKSILLNNK